MSPPIRILKPLALFIFSFFMTWLLTRVSFEKLGLQLNNTVEDLMVALLPHPAQSDQVVTLGMMAPEDSGYLLDRSYPQLKNLLQEVLARHPKFVISAFPLPTMNANEKEMKEFADFASKIDNLYFYSYWLVTDPESLVHHPILSPLHHLFLPLTKDQDRNTVRRTIIQMEVDDGWMDNPLFEVMRKYGISRSPKDYNAFEYMKSYQVYSRYRSFESLQLVPIHEIKSNENLIKDKIVVIGHGIDSEFPDYRAKSPYSLIKELYSGDLTAAQRIGMDLNVLILQDSVQKLMFNAKFILIFLFMSLYIFGVAYLPIVLGFAWGFVMIALWLITTIVGYSLCSIMVSFAPVAVVVVLMHFIASSILMTRYLRAQDREAAEAERRLEIQRLQNEILVKSARADLGLKIAMQVAHDIRSPLTGIRLVAQKTQNEIPPKLSKLTLDCVDRMQAIADDLLSKFRNDDFSEEKSDIVVNLYDLFNQIVSGYKSSWNQVTFNITGDHDLCMTLRHRTEFERAVCNILNNSIEAGAEQVELQFETASRGIVVHIRDNGPGVPVDQISQIFRRGATFGKAEGTGLGLAQVSDAMQMMGGSVRYISENRGAHFVLEIPGNQTQGEVLNVHKRVLIVEDNQTVRNRWQKRLQADGVEVTILSKPEDFVKNDVKEPFTLVTDLIFDNSELTGFKVLEESRKYNCQRILCSSLAGNSDIQRMGSGLADKVLTKTQFEGLIIKLIS